MIDIVYPLGNGSKWNDNELRYSLRSVEKHLCGYRNIVIIGNKPDWLTNVTHIPFEDVHRWKETRIALKVLKVCNDERVSNFFLFMNDDHFLTSEFQAYEFPYYRKETLATTAQKRRFNDAYRKSLVNTYMALTKKGHLTHNFDVHCPIVYNKELFIKMFYDYPEWEETNYGYVVKSMYCNTYKIEGELVRDLKIGAPCSFDLLGDLIKDREFFSIGDKVVNVDFILFMEKLYPQKSIYEK